MPENQGNRLPARAALHPDGLYLALREIGPSELRDAFMQETVARVAAAESVVRIARQDLDRAAPGSAPAGLIFHVARCGSTLISQLLKQHGDCVVYAEPLPFNELLLPPQRWPRALLVGALRSLGEAFARHAGRPYVIKFSSWNTFFCDLLAEAFPDTPWVLSLRDPVEVCVSLVRRPPGWLRNAAGPVASFAGLIDPEGAAGSADEYAARLYGAFCESAARLGPQRGRLVTYETLPGAVWERVAPHFSLVSSAEQRQRMADAARYDAKAPPGKAAAFVGDASGKQAAASDVLRRAVDTFARPPLARLGRIHSVSPGSASR